MGPTTGKNDGSMSRALGFTVSLFKPLWSEFVVDLQRGSISPREREKSTSPVFIRNVIVFFTEGGLLNGCFVCSRACSPS